MASHFQGSSFVLLLLAVAGYCNYPFRFDYQFNQQANGWLKYHVVPATWNEAMLRCHAEGAVLASPLNNELKAAIMTFANRSSSFDDEQAAIHTGVHATYSSGDYSSVEGVPLLRLVITWAPGEPDNRDNSERCLAMGIKNGTMADAPCDDVLPYVCYKNFTQLTVNECGTTDPEYVFMQETGSCYKFHTKSRAWSESYMTCAAEGGYLAIINSEVEAAALRRIKNQYPHSSIFARWPAFFQLGSHDTGLHHNFMTIHGQTLAEAGYEKWLPGEPNNQTETRMGDAGEHCGGVKEGNLGLIDIACSYPAAFLCEMRPNSLR